MNDKRSEEDRLVERAANCDNDAFCALLDRYRQHLRVLVARYAPTRTDLDDMHAEIVARLLADRKRALRMWKPIAPFAAYLTTISVRHCLNWLERNSRRPQTVLLSAGDPHAGEREMLQELIEGDDDGRPDRLVVRHERRDAMARALMELSHSDRLVLALRFDQGMTGPEIGRALGITPGAARQRIFKALRRLAAVIAERDEYESLLAGG